MEAVANGDASASEKKKKKKVSADLPSRSGEEEEKGACCNQSTCLHHTSDVCIKSDTMSWPMTRALQSCGSPHSGPQAEALLLLAVRCAKKPRN